MSRPTCTRGHPLGTGTAPQQKSNVISSAQSPTSQKVFDKLPAERHLFWRSEARKAAATADDDEESGDVWYDDPFDEESEEGR